MEMTTVLTLCYILVIAFLFAPKSESVVVTVNETKTMKRSKKSKFVDPNQLALNFSYDDTKTKKREPNPLHNKTIRELKKLASQAKIKYYCNMTKAQLIEALETA